MNYKIFFVLITVFLFECGFTNNFRSKIKEANKDYENADYEKSLKKYMDINVEHPGNALVEYNIGNTLYKQKRYDEAIEHFEKASVNSDIKLKSKTNYNIGNSLYQQAIQSESAGKLDESIKKMKNAVEYYKQALHNNPSDKDVKYNIEFVQQEIKRILNKIKEQQKNQKNKQNQKKNQQQQQQCQQKDNDGQQKNKSQDKKEQQKKQGYRAQKDQKDKTNKGEKDKKNQPAKKGQELSKQEAQRLLDSLPDKDKKRKKQRVQRGYLGKVEKNW
ncbi:tetratricopeptide repeat protein [bacterium]|nr:tetratricopeptide repeat protein [bacterium]